MNKIKKTVEELESEWQKDIKSNQIKSDLKSKKKLAGKLIVDQSLKKSHPLSIRLPDADIEAIQLKAVKAGIPYQTLIKSVLHQFATDQIKT